MIAFALPPLTLEILDGDIAAESTDAVVNAANNHFWMGSGVAGALKARGGIQLETDAMAQGPVEPGEGVMTSGGRLPARFVIHAAVMGQDLRTSAAVIDRATRNSLRLAETHQLASVAFPAFGTGVGGCPIIRIGIWSGLKAGGCIAEPLDRRGGRSKIEGEAVPARALLDGTPVCAR